MGADDASFADMRRLTDPDADPLALDEETVERLLAGDLPPSQAPPAYAQVAALLAATVAEPTPEELAGRSEVLAELRAVTRTRRAGAHTRRATRPPRRRWAGLAAVALVGALVTGGAAAAASGNLPGPVGDAARSILGTIGGDPGTATPTRSDAQPAPAASGPASAGVTAGPKGPLSTGSTAPGSGPNGAAGPNAVPDKEGLCKAYLASRDKETGKKMDAAAFERLAKAAGGESGIPAYCDGTQPGGPKPKDEQQPPPGGGQGQGQGGSPPDGGGGQGQGQPPSTRASNR
jgi:hypothetical protein